MNEATVPGGLPRKCRRFGKEPIYHSPFFPATQNMSRGGQEGGPDPRVRGPVPPGGRGTPATGSAPPSRRGTAGKTAGSFQSLPVQAVQVDSIGTIASRGMANTLQPISMVRYRRRHGLFSLPVRLVSNKLGSCRVRSLSFNPGVLICRMNQTGLLALGLEASVEGPLAIRVNKAVDRRIKTQMSRAIEELRPDRIVLDSLVEQLLGRNRLSREALEKIFGPS